MTRDSIIQKEGGGGGAENDNINWEIKTSGNREPSWYANTRVLIQYHEKLDETRKLWTIDPVKVIANKINNLPIPDRIIAKMVIGDFGCGRAMLAQLLNNKVYNFDHHSILGENIIACDMKRTTLKNETLDVAVFSLSLMGQNWAEYIAEAKRCLRKRGMLMIAETTKSLTARLSGLKDEITKCGRKETLPS